MESLGTLIRKSVRGKVESEVDGSSTQYHQLERGVGGGSDLPGMSKPMEAYSNEAFVGGTTKNSDARPRNKKQKNRKQESNEIQMRHIVPKTAWNAIDPDGNSDREPDEPATELEEPEVDEATMECSSYFPGDADDLETLLNGIDMNRKISADCVEKWKSMNVQVAGKASEAHADVEKRKLALLDAIDEHSRRLHEGLNDQVDSFKVELRTAIGRLEEAMEGMNQVMEMRSHLNGNHVGLLKENLSKWLSEFSDLKPPAAVPVVCTPTQTGSLVEKLFENIHEEVLPGEGGTAIRKVEVQSSLTFDERQISEVACSARLRELPTQFAGVRGAAIWGSPPKGKGDRDKTRNYTDTLRLQYKVCSTLRPVITFSCRMSKDKRTCGVTDLVVIDNGDVIVVDKHNKCLKMYDSSGSLRGFFAKSHLRKPSRVSYLRHGDQVAVTDDATACVLVFTVDGQLLSRLTSLRRPVSHCQLDGGHVALLEFSDRSVVVCDLEGEPVRTFPTQMECPAYMASTSSGRIVVTDWKTGSMKIFDSSGKEHFSHSYSSTPPPKQPSSSIDQKSSKEMRRFLTPFTTELEEPYGVCCDDDGIVMVTDRKRREVVFYTEEGREIWSYGDPTDSLGIPFAISCNGKDIMVVGEYTGTIRIFQYKLAPDIAQSEA